MEVQDNQDFVENAIVDLRRHLACRAYHLRGARPEHAAGDGKVNQERLASGGMIVVYRAPTPTSGVLSRCPPVLWTENVGVERNGLIDLSRHVHHMFFVKVVS